MRNPLILFALLVTALSSRAAGGVFNDAAAWWKLDYANSGSVTSASQIVDSSVNHRNATSISNSSVTPEIELSWTTVPAVGPGGLPAVGPEQRGLRFQPVVTKAVSEGPDEVSNATFVVSNFSVSGSATFMTRFKWDGRITDDDTWAWLCYNGLNINQGWLLGFNTANKLSYYVAGGTGASTSTAFIPGTWYDLAMVLNDDDGNGKGSVTFYLVPENGTLITDTAATNADIRTLSGTTFRIGGEADGTGTGGNFVKPFSGVIDYIAVWDRALSADEVREAMVPEPSTLSLVAGLFLAVGGLWVRRR
jgi:hypothetical protein